MIGFEPSLILDFDIEVRPLGWYGGDYVHKEPTVIASAWIFKGIPVDLEVLYITKRAGSEKTMLKKFLKRYEMADMVTGHFIRGFDLPILNAAMHEWDLGPLPPKNSHDTKLDAIKGQGLSSSQENLGSMYELNHPKIPMTMADWRQANRLTPAGIRLAVKRAAGDVLQHVDLRNEQLRRGFLGAPKVWDPGGSGPTSSYTA